MLALAQSEFSPRLSPTEVIPNLHQGTSADNICRDIPLLVSRNLMVDADALSLWGIRQFPEHEEILALRALVCEVRQDWSSADSALGQLVQLQNFKSPPQTWLHWVRVLRCLGEPDRAMAAIRAAKTLHPSDLGLDAEYRQLQINDCENLSG
jgi:hypothetical protein